MKKKEKYLLSVIAEGIKNYQKAEKLAQQLIKKIDSTPSSIIIEPYSKLVGAFKIDIQFEVIIEIDSIHYSIRQTNKLFTPWLTYYKQDSADVELIFNKHLNQQFRKQEFKVITWANWQRQEETE